MTRATALLLLVALAASCRTTPKDAPGPEPQGTPEMSPEQMMARMQELATPGEGHRRLQPLVGTFAAHGEFWMDPSAPPTTATGTSTNTWILGGRFVRQDYRGDFMGQTFRGLGITGFNNATHEYESVWVDSMGTMIMPASTGTSDASGKVITFVREFDDPMTGRRTRSREVLTIVDDDHHTFEWYQPGPDGREALTMKIGYARAGTD